MFGGSAAAGRSALTGGGKTISMELEEMRFAVGTATVEDDEVMEQLSLDTMVHRMTEARRTVK